MVQIVAISGKVNSGKNYFSYLCQTFSISGYPKIEEIAFADSLKEIVRDFIYLLLEINISREKLDYLKNHGMGIYYMTSLKFTIFMVMLSINIISISMIEYPYDYIKYVTLFGMIQFVYSYNGILTDIKFKILSIILFIFTLIMIMIYQLKAFIIASSFIITLVCYMITKRYTSTPTMRHILQVTGTNIIRKHLGEQVFVIALLNKIVQSDADVIMIPDCRMNEYNLLVYWAPIILKHKKYNIHQVYIERDVHITCDKSDHNRVMTHNEKNHISETVELSNNCVYLKNDGTVLGFLDISGKYWHENIMPQIRRQIDIK